jgi:Nucleotidyl transferase AbiEii toxin, Type IV TA system
MNQTYLQTASNLFLRDMPRLSVDLDLVFTDYALTRPAALTRINNAIRASTSRLRARGFTVFVPTAVAEGETTLMARQGAIEVKVEINTVLRGAVHPERRCNMVPAAREALLADLEIPILAPEDVYGGKLVAAFDRQHPRDLFDVMELFAHGGITLSTRRAFIVYLSSHHRPVHEVLFPSLEDIRMDYERNFQGMTSEEVDLRVLLNTRDRMIAEIHAHLDPSERQFLLSLVAGEPDWGLLGIAHLRELPAIRWKLQNLERLRRERPDQFARQKVELEKRLTR